MGTAGDGNTCQTAQQLAVACEPDLRLLKGLITVLRYLGERSPSDQIEPSAIAALAIPAEDAVERLLVLQREVHNRSWMTRS